MMFMKMKSTFIIKKKFKSIDFFSRLQDQGLLVKLQIQSDVGVANASVLLLLGLVGLILVSVLGHLDPLGLKDAVEEDALPLLEIQEHQQDIKDKKYLLRLLQLK